MLRLLDRNEIPADALRVAEQFCAQMARREARNFYWGFISLPYDQRIAIYALYDFARQIDDEADDDLPQSVELPQRLRVHRDRVHRALDGKVDRDDPIALVLARSMKRYRIPEAEVQMLIDGCEMDHTVKRYRTWEELREYCRHVASIVGRMCVRIFGFTDDAALRHADDLGLALQLTNILRDIREDAERGRIYLPSEDLARFNLTEEDVFSGRTGPAWDAFIAFEAERARGLFDSGALVLKYISRRPAVCVQTMAGIYAQILGKIERDPVLPLRARAALTKTEKLRVVLESWLRPA